MKFFLISDNLDSCKGFRLAGIEGIVVNSREELLDNVFKCLDDPEIGIILITEKLIELDYKTIYDLKLKHSKPLIVEIPSPESNFELSRSITKYIKEAIGVKI